MNPPGSERHGVTITTGAEHNLDLKTVVGDAVNNLVTKKSREDAAYNQSMTDVAQNASFTTATTEIANGKPNKNAIFNTGESTTKGTEGDGHNSNLEVSLLHSCEQPLN